MDHPAVVGVVARPARVARLQDRIVEIDQVLGELEHLGVGGVRAEMVLGDLPVAVSRLDHHLRCAVHRSRRRRNWSWGRFRGDEIDHVSGLQHPRIGVPEAGCVDVDQALHLRVHVGARCGAAELGLGNRPVAVAGGRGVLTDERCALRCRQVSVGGRAEESGEPRFTRYCRLRPRHCRRGGRKAQIPAGLDPPRLFPDLAVWSDRLVPVELPDFGPPRRISERSLGERLGRFALEDSYEPSRHRTFRLYRRSRHRGRHGERPRRVEARRRHETRGQ